MRKKADSYQIEEYNYDLPESRIAKFPLEKRDESKLLVYQANRIIESTFKNLVDHLPENSFLLFNDTKVISARILFRKETGARIEVFLLEPVAPYTDFTQAMETRNECVWKCTIGNKKKWKEDTDLSKTISKEHSENPAVLKVSYEKVEENLVKFIWSGDFSFAEVLEHVGEVPIPPYLERDAEEIDKDRYQTVYSKSKGAVAAPTAGLHFSDEIMQSLKNKNISHDFVTLHVSAGTFRPVQSQNYLEHNMHKEQIVVGRSTLEKIIRADNIICVGTTSLRTLESLYWMGVKRIKSLSPFTFVEKLLPYELKSGPLPSPAESLSSLYSCLEESGKDVISGETEIFIVPSYDFKMCKGLITNFHLPKSTLLLLIAAFVGPSWKDIYDTALQKNFRFLSYGDSSLLLR